VPKPPLSANSLNQQLIGRLEKRASEEDAVLGPCLQSYRASIAQQDEPLKLLHNLTAPLLGAFEATRKSIVDRFSKKWADDSDLINRSVANSLRRSAGTNYQALVSYALAQYLLRTESAWYLVHPVPEVFRRALAITFTGGVQPDVSPDAGANDDISESAESAAYTIQPDVDILLRNFSWTADLGATEPVVLLSVKTSLVDRAGMAARWKTYFDQATHPCVFQDRPECVYRRLGITMANHDSYNILHGIVTANIYKINFHDERYRIGELSSGQTRSNTYMFDLKLTTRDDGIAITPSDWRQFESLPSVLADISQRYGLPG
jgi:hypothetical protein